MNSSTHYSQLQIRSEGRVLALVAILLSWSLLVNDAAAQRKDYFTELEVSDIQTAQQVDYRTDVLIGIADRRLALLVADDDSAAGNEPGLGEKVGRTLATIFSPQIAAEIQAAKSEREAMDDDLSGHDHVALLRGYYQALDEAMDNIDDAYERKTGDVTGPLTSLRDFAEAAMPFLRNIETESSSEQRALQDAIEQTELALKGAKQALENIPRDAR